MNKALRLITTALITVYCTGCAVLTDSQVKAVNEFAKAGQQYTELPSAAMKTYADSKYKMKLYEIANIDKGDVDDKGRHSFIKQIDKALKNKSALYKEADKTDKILKVIDTYILLLSKLTSDDFSSQLAKETVDLGKELNSAVTEYNDAFGVEKSTTPSWGNYVAAGVRGLGGYLIKRKQTIALKEAVSRAEPEIAKIEKSLNSLLDSISKRGSENINELTSAYKSFIKTSNDLDGKPKSFVSSVADLEEFIKAREKAKLTVTLCQKSKSAFSSFKQAHTKLYDSLKKKQRFTNFKETIQSLADEGKSAKEIIKQLESK